MVVRPKSSDSKLISKVPEPAAEILKGQVRGRVVIDVNV